QAAMALVAAALLGAGVWFTADVEGDRARPLLLGAGAAAAVLGCFMREFHRSVEFLDHRADRALAGDIVYLILVGGVLGALGRARGGLPGWMVLAAIGVGAFLPGLFSFLRGGNARTSIDDCRRASRLLVGQGKWTLPGMAVTWGQTTGYSYIVAYF